MHATANRKQQSRADAALREYAQAKYEKAGGIVDLTVNAAQANLIRDGLIAFQADPSVWVALADANNNMHPNPSQVILVETPLTAQTDRRSIYLNENESTTFQISVKNKGKPAPGANVLVVKYNPPGRRSGPVNAIATNAPQVVNITNGQPAVITVTPDGDLPIQTNATIVQADANGMATVTVQAANPGFPVFVFYPYLSGQAQPAATGSFDEVGTAMFTTIRVLSYDDAIVDQFVHVVEFDARSREGVELRLLQCPLSLRHDLPGLLKFVPLGDRQRVEAAIDQVLALVSPKYFPESTLAMPITRDLSRGSDRA